MASQPNFIYLKQIGPEFFMPKMVRDEAKNG
jgi:hypothetical protein